MTTNYTDAIDSMFALFNAAWTESTPAIVGYVPEIQWPLVEKPEVPLLNKFFARISVQTVDESQTTLRNGSNQRYTNNGLLFVQIFAPRSVSDSATKLKALAKMVKNTFRGHTDADNIWFRSSRIQELPPESKFYNFNVVVDYQYDEIS